MTFCHVVNKSQWKPWEAVKQMCLSTGSSPRSVWALLCMEQFVVTVGVLLCVVINKLREFQNSVWRVFYVFPLLGLKLSLTTLLLL